ncbi:MAG: superoxide dismutase [Ni] [Planctomycetota bacterium]|jgi:nickel superoxide dismutase
MNKIALSALAAVVLSAAFYTTADAHCEVPCGIFTDQMRFELMLEDTTTIAKSMDQINKLNSATDAQSKNQLVRWVTNKEKHAEKIQHIISQYFMAQRIKANDPKYVDKLTKSHAVMVAAMKCKQTVDTKAADTLKAAILAFHKAYEGK